LGVGEGERECSPVVVWLEDSDVTLAWPVSDSSSSTSSHCVPRPSRVSGDWELSCLGAPSRARWHALSRRGE
jgi:hypothetical protein